MSNEEAPSLPDVVARLEHLETLVQGMVPPSTTEPPTEPLIIPNATPEEIRAVIAQRRNEMRALSSQLQAASAFKLEDLRAVVNLIDTCMERIDAMARMLPGGK